MATDTSIKAYYEIIAEGYLAKTQLQVAEAIREHSERTDKEISIITGLPINVITARRNELVKMGIVEDMGKKRCPITGRPAHYWRTREKILFRPLKQPQPI